MKLLLQSATIVHPGTAHHGEVMDILIEDGVVSKIGKSIKAEGATIVAIANLHVAPGFFDIGTQFCDPGMEHKEDLESGVAAAAAGGYTGVALMPNTTPVADSKSVLEYWKNKSQSLPVSVFGLGAVTKKTEGKVITEMVDMYHAGALGFTDGNISLQHDGVMLRALQYVKPFNGIVLQHPDDVHLSENGQMNESETSVSLGMKGKADIAEELMVSRNIELCKYAESKLHFFNITTPGSIARVQAAQKAGVQISAGISPMYVALDDTALETFDSHYKVDPPLRTNAAVKAIKKALKDNVISCISSWHQPQNIELKKTEFEYATEGIINLQTCFALANTYLSKELSLDNIISLMSIQPRKIMGLPLPETAAGNPANLVLFNPDEKIALTEKDILSKSKNTPFIGKELRGRIYGIVNGKHFVNHQNQ